MATTIVTKNSSTASAVPTAGQLVQGELAVNVADKKLYTEDNAGSIIVLADGVKLAGIEALADVTDTANVTAAGALMDSELTNIASVKALNQGVATTDSPTFAGATLTTADINAGTIDGTVIGGSTAAAGTFTTGQFNTSLNVDGTVTADKLITDSNVDAASFTSASSTYVDINNGTVTGRLQTISSDFFIGTATVGTSLAFKSGNNVERLRISSGGDISFYEDTGTTAKLFWDASAESLGIGTTSPSLKGHINNASSGLPATSGTTQTNGVLRLSSSATSGIIDFGMNSSSPWIQATDYTGLNNNYNLLLNPNGGNVGIGTSSPSSALDVTGTVTATSVNTGAGAAGRNALSSGDIRVAAPNDTNISLMTVSNTLATIKTDYYGGGSLVPLVIQTGANNNQLYLDTGGNVGIGTSSPAANRSLHVSSAPQNQARFERTGASTVQIEFQDSTTTNQPSLGGDGDSLTFRTSFTERMRIDSSGNLLVGKPATNFTVAGHEIKPASFAGFTRDGGAPVVVNRLTNDGALIELYSGATTVGSLGSAGSGVRSYYAGNNVGISPYNGVVYPTDGSGTAANNSADLGANGYAFKDLYLSGGVYLGGTGAANKLDDYETGSFTPTVYGSTTAGTATYTIQTGFYEKIGRLVHFQLYLDWSGFNGTGELLVVGLPFSSSSDSNMYTAISSYVSDVALTANNVAQGFLVNQGDTSITCKEAPVGGGGASGIAVDGSGTMLLSGTYRSV
jgi:hypothetical protein